LSVKSLVALAISVFHRKINARAAGAASLGALAASIKSSISVAKDLAPFLAAVVMASPFFCGFFFSPSMQHILLVLWSKHGQAPNE
jgi:hypothetical protein